MQQRWPLWRRMMFRFFFIYLTLQMEPWTWLDQLPWIGKATGFLTKYYYQAMEWMVRRSNDWFFHVKKVLVMPNGSGDTSFGWANQWFLLSAAALGMIIWSIAERHRTQYTKLNYWLCLFARYYVALVLFLYGIIKLFGLQMPFPTQSNLATPLGDLLPMRLSWLFIGYSAPYQFFSGLMETVAGLLLLYRRTTTLGVLVATGVFLNVAVLNLSYDIPVKIFSIQMVIFCLFLLANESERILCFFVYNKPANACTVYHYEYPKKWMKWTRVVLKLVFIYLAVISVFIDTVERKKNWKAQFSNMVFEPGLYDITNFKLKKDTTMIVESDSVRWRNLVFDTNSFGTVATDDTAFLSSRRYHRSFFRYKIDTAQKTFDMTWGGSQRSYAAAFHYEFGDSSVLFRGRKNNDSIYFALRKNPHQFQLAERQFHWLSEANR